jgi:Flp pilus assembly protein TadD
MKRAWLALAAVVVLGGGLSVYKLSQPTDHAAEGYAALKAGRSHDAIDELRLAVKEKPDWASLHYDLGIAYENVGWTEQALPELEKSVEIEPANHEYREGLAQTKRTVGYRAQVAQRWDDAAKLYQSSLLLSPNDATTWYNLGLVLQKLSRNAEATRAVARADELDPAHKHLLPGGS